MGEDQSEIAICEMMKAGVLTFHNSLNCGAVLQAYALQTILQRLGVKVYVLDFLRKRDNVKCFSAESLSALYHSLRRLVLERIRIGKYARFRRRVLNLTRTIRASDQMPTEFDVFLVGSDQVWNPVNNERNMHFFLDFVPCGKKRIAYAASCGAKSFPTDYEDQMKPLLGKFNAISVREQEAIPMLERLTGLSPSLVCDPSLLLDAEDYLRIASARRQVKEPYVCVYVIGQHGKALAIARNIADRIGVRRIVILGNRRAEWRLPDVGREKNVYMYGPSEFLRYVSDAEFVVTNSFHGTAFSLVFNKEFVSALNGTEGDGRMLTLLDRVGLRSRALLPTWKGLPEAAIDYNKVVGRLGVLRAESLMFLKEALEL